MWQLSTATKVPLENMKVASDAESPDFHTKSAHALLLSPTTLREIDDSIRMNGSRRRVELLYTEFSKSQHLTLLEDMA